MRHLLPYTSLPAEAQGQSEAAKRRSAESLLCVLSVLDAVLSQQRHCEAATLGELLADLHQLINRHPFVQVLAGACTCLTTLAHKEEAAAGQLASLAAVYDTWLREPGAAASQPGLLSRFLFILGQLCRRGMDLLESTPPEGSAEVLTMPECQRLFVEYCSGKQRNVKVRRLGTEHCLKPARDPRAWVQRLQRHAPPPRSGRSTVLCSAACVCV